MDTNYKPKIIEIWDVKVHIPRWFGMEWPLSAAGEGKKSFFYLPLRMMGKAADQSEFNRGQIVMSKRFRTSISEAAWLIGFLWSAVASVYEKWINNGKTSIGCPCIIKEKGCLKLLYMVK